MHKNKKNEELQTRREFFKRAAKGALPILGISLFGPTILTSCEKDDPDDDGGGGSSNGCGKSCSGGCSGSCSGSCDTSCSGNCDSCTGSCAGTGCSYM